MFFGGQTHLEHDTKWKGVVGPLRFSKFPLSDHGIHAKIVQQAIFITLGSFVSLEI